MPNAVTEDPTKTSFSESLNWKISHRWRTSPILTLNFDPASTRFFNRPQQCWKISSGVYRLMNIDKLQYLGYQDLKNQFPVWSRFSGKITSQDLVARPTESRSVPEWVRPVAERRCQLPGKLQTARKQVQKQQHD